MKKYFGLLWITLLIGCTSQPPVLSVDQQREAALYLAQYRYSQRDALEPVTGVYVGDRFRSRFIAYFDQKELVLIEELYDQAGLGRAEYYFREQKLYLVKKSIEHKEHKEEIVAQRTLLILGLDGATLSAEEQEGSQLRSLSGDTQVELIRHAEILKNAVEGFDPSGLVRGG